MTTTWNPEAGRPGVLVGVTQRHLQRTAARNAAFFLPHLGPGMSLLDVGCGPGTITAGLAELVRPGEVVGLDIDHEQVRKANALASERALPNLRFNMGDIYRLPFAADSFDAVFAHTVFMHLKDPLRAAREVLRVLKPGGVFGVSERLGKGTVDGNFTALLRLHREIADAYAAHRGVDFGLAARLRPLLGQAGFEGVVASASYGEVYGTVDATQGWARIMMSYLHAPELARFVTERGLADEETLEQIAKAWEAWGDDPDSFHAQANGEAVGWKSKEVEA